MINVYNKEIQVLRRGGFCWLGGEDGWRKKMNSKISFSCRLIRNLYFILFSFYLYLFSFHFFIIFAFFGNFFLLSSSFVKLSPYSYSQWTCICFSFNSTLPTLYAQSVFYSCRHRSGLCDFCQFPSSLSLPAFPSPTCPFESVSHIVALRTHQTTRKRNNKRIYISSLDMW